VLQAILVLYKKVVNLPTTNTPLAFCIADDFKYSFFFTDCIGVLNRTYINVFVGPEEQPWYRNRKGELTQNVLAAYNFDMEFIYFLAGWEGLAHNNTVYRDAYYYKGFITSFEKYWLRDAGYPNSDIILTSYCGTRYYLKEQRLARKKPENLKELFNLRHSLL
jgi:hypothetical protein